MARKRQSCRITTGCHYNYKLLNNINLIEIIRDIKYMITILINWILNILDNKSYNIPSIILSDLKSDINSYPDTGLSITLYSKLIIKIF